MIAFSRLLIAATCGFALLAAAPASARTICDAYGNCYNTSGRPIYQPQYSYNYYPQPGWWYWRHHHHRHHHYYYGNDDDKGQ